MSETQPTLYVVVPVLDEAANLERLLGGLRESFAALSGEVHCRVVLVDDGSRDGTAMAARELQGSLDLTVLTHPVNRGPGHAFGTAFEHLAPLLGDEDRVVTMEGDNTSRHELLGRMLTRMREGFDAVLASPYLYGGGIVHTSPTRVLLSHLGNGFAKKALGIHGILTLSSFFRVYRGSMVRRLQAAYGPRIVERAGFDCALELLMKLVYLGAGVSEVAMVLDNSRRAGRSKMRVTRTSLAYLALWGEKRRWRHAAERVISEGASRSHPGRGR